MSSIKTGFLKFIVFFLLSQTAAWGGTIDLTSVAQDQFKKVSKELGLAVSYIPASPAEPLGITGFDIGLEVTAATVSKDTFQPVTSDPPSLIPLPKIHVQKGLPLGIDVGAVYSTVPELDLTVIGGELKYAILAGNVALPAVAARVGLTKLSGLSTLDLSTLSYDLSVSKGFLLVTPFAGVGQVTVTSTPKGLPGLTEEKQSMSKVFAGVKVSLALINFVFEADFADNPLYTVRANVGF